MAGTLERRWENKLAALTDAEQALAAAREALSPLPGRAELERLAADLPRLWSEPTISNKDRKRLLRSLIADITLLPEPDRAKARIGIRWHTGATADITLLPKPDRAKARIGTRWHTGTAKRSPSPAVAMVTRLGPTTPTAELVDLLNAAGHNTGTGAPFDGTAVQWIRHAFHIPAPNPYAYGEISVAEAAHRLGCSTGTVYDWIKTGKLSARATLVNGSDPRYFDRVTVSVQKHPGRPNTSYKRMRSTIAYSRLIGGSRVGRRSWGIDGRPMGRS